MAIFNFVFFSQMKIFVKDSMGLLCGDGGTVSVEVEAKSSIAELKEKIQV